MIFNELDKSEETATKSVQSDILRYWLEEGTELELTQDEKYERLSNLVDDIDEVIKALRNCMSLAQIEEVTKTVEERISRKLNFERIEAVAKQRIEAGEA